MYNKINMKVIRFTLITCLFCLGMVAHIFAQTDTTYSEYIGQAEYYYHNKEYLKAAEFYSKAFASNKDKGRIDHRYNAACCWAECGLIDSAYHQLERITKNGNYISYYKTARDPELKTLHTDRRWQGLLETIKANKEKIEPHLDEPLAAILDTMLFDDQAARKQIEGIEQKYGWKSREIDSIWQLINRKDSINVVKAKNILNTYGWPGEDVVGKQNSNTLFLVIQHSDQKTQEEYLPMMREAVKKGNASASSLALLEDRVALRQGKKQIYGTQISRNEKTGRYYVLGLEDPENVDERRAAVNLPPLRDYVKHWGISWSIQQYEQDLAQAKN